VRGNQNRLNEFRLTLKLGQRNLAPRQRGYPCQGAFLGTDCRTTFRRVIPSRVDELLYSLEVETKQRWDFSELSVKAIRLGDFDCRVEGSELTARPALDFEDEESARAALEPLLADWSAVIELDHRVPLRFRFVGARVRNPREEEGSPVTYHVSRAFATAYDVAGVDPKLHVLPSPPSFADASDLRLIRERLREYRFGRGALLQVGGYAYTVFTRRYGGRKNAPTKMNVEPKILETLNDISSNRSHPQHERKSLRGKPQLTDDEQTWVEAAIVALVKQAGAIDAGTSPKSLR
jgi:hypothetical protein